MNCAEFRRQFHRLLDTRQGHAFSEEMEEHVRSCNVCSAHVHAMGQIDSALREAPDVEVPLELERKLEAIPSKYGKKARMSAWSEELRHAALYLVPAVLVVIIGLQLPPEFQFCIQTAIATAGLTGMLVRGLGRRAVMQ